MGLIAVLLIAGAILLLCRALDFTRLDPELARVLKLVAYAALALWFLWLAFFGNAAGMHL